MAHILIVVDDETQRARSQQMLRAYRRDWRLTFESSAPAAIERLSEQPCDAVAVDLSLAENNPKPLLIHAQSAQPAALRLLVCGSDQHSQLLGTIGLAHQVLPRPYDPEAFRELVENAFSLATRLERPGLKRLAGEIESLPSLPDVFLELLNEMGSPDASIDRVAALIAKDLGMSAKMLQLINSPFFGFRCHVRDVPHAAALLGLNALQPLVLTAGIFRKLEALRVPASFLRELFEHSLAVGSLAQRIAKDCRLTRQEADQALVGGILHDIGKLVLADHFGREYAIVREAAQITGLPLEAAEDDQFAASHAEIGAYLLALWGLPFAAIDAVAFHHSATALAKNKMDATAAVYVANALINVSQSQDEKIEGIECLPDDGPATNCLSFLKTAGCAEHLNDWCTTAQSSVCAK